MRGNTGFWSFDPSSAALSCCPTAAGILGISASHSGIMRDVLMRLHAPDRRQLLRVGLAAVRRRSTFDIVVLVRTPAGLGLVRVIGGVGYELEQRDAQLHGIVEQIALEGPALWTA